MVVTVLILKKDSSDTASAVGIWRLHYCVKVEAQDPHLVFAGMSGVGVIVFCFLFFLVVVFDGVDSLSSKSFLSCYAAPFLFFG